MRQKNHRYLFITTKVSCDDSSISYVGGDDSDHVIIVMIVAMIIVVVTILT